MCVESYIYALMMVILLDQGGELGQSSVLQQVREFSTSAYRQISYRNSWWVVEYFMR